jgi:hypothetical protein
MKISESSFQSIMLRDVVDSLQARASNRLIASQHAGDEQRIVEVPRRVGYYHLSE